MIDKMLTNSENADTIEPEVKEKALAKFSRKEASVLWEKG